MVIRKTDLRGGMDDLAEQLLALEERAAAEVVTIAIEKIKGEEDDGKFGEKGGRRLSNVHAFLEFFEIAAAEVVEDGDLGVEDGLRGGDSGGELLKLGILRGNVVAGTSAESELAIVKEGEGANTIPFDFEEPIGIGEGMIGEGSEHGAEFGRHDGLAGAFQFGRMNWRGGTFGSELLLDFVKDAAGKNGTVVLVDVPVGVGGGVLVLNHEPFVALFAVFELDEDEAAAKLFTVEAEFNFAAGDLRERVEVAFGLKGAAIPDHDGAGAVAAFGNGAFEVGVVEWVIFGLDGEALVVGIEGGALGNGPRFEGAVHGETEIVVEAAGGVFLDDEGGLGSDGGVGSGGFGSTVELTFLVVLGELVGTRH